MRRFFLYALAFSLVVVPASEPHASSRRSIAATVAFERALNLSDKTDISFGFVQALQSGVYTISTSGVVTTSEGGLWLGGDSHAGRIMIVGSDNQPVTISVNNYVMDNGVTPLAAVCSYDGGPSVPCPLSNQAPPGAGKDLLLGISLAVDGTQEIKTSAAPSFEVLVTYN